MVWVWGKTRFEFINIQSKVNVQLEVCIHRVAHTYSIAYCNHKYHQLHTVTHLLSNILRNVVQIC